MEAGWAWVDSTEIRTLWLDTATIAQAGSDTFAIATAFRFPKPIAGRDSSAMRPTAEARLRHLVECRDHRMRTLDYDTRDADGAITDAGRVDSEWFRPFDESSYANLIALVCEFEHGRSAVARSRARRG